MTPERAKQILAHSNNHFGAMNTTEEERAEVIALWDRMPDSTCFADAVAAIAYPDKWPSAHQGQ